MVKRPGPTSKSRARTSRKRSSSRLLDFDPRALDHIQAMVRDPDGTINYWARAWNVCTALAPWTWWAVSPIKFLRRNFRAR